MFTEKYLIFLCNVLCLLHVSSCVSITPSQSIPTELFKPIKANSEAPADTNRRDVEVDSLRFSQEPPANPVDTRQQVFTRPNDQRLQPNPFLVRQTAPGFRPEVVRNNNFAVQQEAGVPEIDQNGYYRRTYTVPGPDGQATYTVNAYQSPTYYRTWSWSSDGDRTENFSVGPPSRLPNGFSINDLPFDDKFVGGINNVPFGETQTFRSGFHTVRTTGPDGITREKTTTW